MAEKTESEDRHGSVRLAAPWYATTLPRWRSHQLPTPAWECVKIKSGCSLCSKRVFLSLIGMNVPSTPPRDHTHNIISKIVNYMLKHVRDGGTHVCSRHQLCYASSGVVLLINSLMVCTRIWASARAPAEASTSLGPHSFFFHCAGRTQNNIGHRARACNSSSELTILTCFKLIGELCLLCWHFPRASDQDSGGGMHACVLCD